MPENMRLTFLKGMRDGIPIMLGYLSVSFAFGIVAIEKGLPLWAPIVISLTNLTGTGQFVGVDLICANAALPEIAFTLFIINLRYSLMSLSLSQKLSSKVTLWQRLVIAFGNTDEIFAVSMQQPCLLNFRYLIGLILISVLGWNGGTILGAVANHLLPMAIRNALGIALYAMFIAIIIPPARDSSPILKIVLLATAMSCLFTFVPGLSSLGSGWIIIICGVTASALGAWLYPIPEKEEESDEQ